jgi:glycosyltransferase involved in cell wall biosynthesis
MSRMKTILHISADFPDPMVPGKTRAVERLVAATEGFRHVVYSINRVNWRTDIAMQQFGEDRIALAYGAPSYGFRLFQHLHPVAEAVGADMRRRGIRPDLIHAHKFTVDGVIADRLGATTGAPVISNLWGDTDTKFFEAKPGLRAHYRDIARRVAVFLPPAPWTARYFSVALGVDARRMKVLPVMTAADDIIQPRRCGKPRLITVFSWDAWKRKGFDTLIKAVALVAQDLPDIRLDVFGRGCPKTVLAMTKLVERSGIADKIRLQPPLDNAKVQQTINGYAAFAMPSRRETYGMVYVEALLAGVPILWSQGLGVDGVFDGMDIGYASAVNSRDDVARGLRVMFSQEERLKAEIGRLQSEGSLNHVRREAIVARYRDVLASILATPQRAAA